MTVVLLNRQPRRPGPELPDGEIQLQEPPVLPERQGGMSGFITMAPMALSSLSMVVMFLRPGSGGGALTWIAMGMMVISAIGMLATQLLRGSSDRKHQLRAERRDYLRYLAQMRRQVRKSITQQQEALAWRNPEPAGLWSLVRTSRLWERRAAHPDFGDVRVARGTQRLAMRMAPLATKPVEDLEPLCAHALRRFINAYSTVDDLPIAVHVRGYAHILLRGDDIEEARALARAVVAQLALFHAPDELRIAVVADGSRREDWEWTKWLPHALHPRDSDGAGPIRLSAPTVTELEQLLGEDFGARPPWEPDSEPSHEDPYYFVVIDGPPVAPISRAALAGYRNATVVDVGESLEWKAAKHTLRLRIREGALEMVTTDRNRKESHTALGRPDGLSLPAARRYAELVAPYRLGDSAEPAESLATDVQLTGLLGISDLLGFEPAETWGQRKATDLLRVPIGVGVDGSPIELDIKESAQGGMGPHGLLIGATGSGKSELLRTIVLALALTHSSEILNFVLVDFKGGATFLGLEQLPHVSALITNLADEAELVERMRDALHGELVRRQELLRATGFSSLLEYETSRAAGSSLSPLPTLMVVVDEFSELLATNREFIDLFIMIGRLGRSLGVHLLLASQRLDEGRMHALESHLSYRIGLRTFSAMESRAVLGVPDAHQLPPQPGNGFLRNEVSVLSRFKAAYVSGAYRRARSAERQAIIAGQVVPYGVDYVTPRQPAAQVPEPVVEEAEESPRPLLDIAAERLRDAGPPAHQIWLPPLGDPPTLDELLPPLIPDPEHGLTCEGWPGRGGLAVPIGVIDRPFQQLRDLLVADVSGAGGHVGIAGAPQSGKSNLVRTLLASLALTHTPREVQFYCLDFGGGTLAALRGLPHVGGVTARHDVEAVNRTVAEVNSVIARRERAFAQLGVDSVASFRQRKARGEFPEDAYGDVFLVIDGWSTLRQEFPDLVPVLTLIAGRGLNFGVHLIVASTRWGEIPGALRDQLGTRLELHLGDTVDSTIGMRAAAKVPSVPGRGLTTDQMHFLSALPRIDGVGDSGTVGDAVVALVDTIDELWAGPRAPVIRTLPAELPVSELPAPEGRLRVAIGLEETHVSPLWHDFEESPHLVIVGDSETGKTNLLRLVASAITRAYGPSEARICLVDFRRTLYEEVPEEYRLGYAVGVDVLRQVVDGMTRAMTARQPPLEATPAQLRSRDWWTGPELFVLIDDYELVPTSHVDHPFSPVLDLLALGREVGLHFIVARSANGAGRAMNDPLLHKLNEVNTPAVLFSCQPSEGYLFGNAKPRILPPGRALHITRRRTVQIQTALAPPSGDR